MDIFSNMNILLMLAIIWVLPWKGYALWLSARNNQKWWFIIILVVNTLAIVEIVYIFLIAKRNKENTAIKADMLEAEIVDKEN